MVLVYKKVVRESAHIRTARHRIGSAAEGRAGERSQSGGNGAELSRWKQREGLRGVAPFPSPGAAHYQLWASAIFCGSVAHSDTVKVPRAFVERLTDAVCYAA